MWAINNGIQCSRFDGMLDDPAAIKAPNGRLKGLGFRGWGLRLGFRVYNGKEHGSYYLGFRVYSPP